VAVVPKSHIFQYWDTIGEVYRIAHVCGVCRRTTKISKSISFEVKYPIEPTPFSIPVEATPTQVILENPYP